MRLGLFLLLSMLPNFALADAIDVPAKAGALTAAINAAKAGQVLRLGHGRHNGNLTITRPITIECDKIAQIIGTGEGTVITVDAPDVTIRGCEIMGSGSSGPDLDSGIKLTKKATRAFINNNTLKGNFYGVDVHGAIDARVTENTIIGRDNPHMNKRGNGVHVWNAPGSEVSNNVIKLGRDGIFVTSSNQNVFTGNHISNLRFAIHYMYAHDSKITGNISQDNHLGYAVMYSDRVGVIDNISMNDRDHGVMLNYTNESLISGNTVEGGPEKCIFIYNAHKNRIEENWLQNCNYGIHFTAGSERNVITQNAFVANRTQVKYAGTNWVDWSEDGLGNYWSDYQAYDLDGDGIAEGKYRPNDAVDHILWTQPAARLLLGSPAVQLVRWSQSTFPALLPGGVVDSAPLMDPPQKFKNRLEAHRVNTRD